MLRGGWVGVERIEKGCIVYVIENPRIAMLINGVCDVNIESRK